eukprot:c39072_g1_i1.p1 GENE.c39072_g1_i1~~c39072_g1_i1.p1  ORF type:complete len:766 (+),score=221.84 c39072_g1_i1:49-2298(+)
MSNQGQKVRVTVLSGTNFGADVAVSVRVTFGQFVVETEPISSANPQFNETFLTAYCFGGSNSSPKLVFQVLSEGGQIGSTVIDLSKVVEGIERDIQKRLDDGQGVLNIKLYLERSASIPDDLINSFKKLENVHLAKRGKLADRYREQLQDANDKKKNLQQAVDTAEKEFKRVDNQLKRRKALVAVLQESDHVVKPEQLKEVQKLEEEIALLEAKVTDAKKIVDAQTKTLNNNKNMIENLHSVVGESRSIARQATGGDDSDAHEKASVALQAIGFSISIPEGEEQQSGGEEEDEQAAQEAEVLLTARNTGVKTVTLSAEAERWLQKYEREKEAKEEWRQKCQEMEELHLQMTEIKQETDHTAAQKLQELENLRAELLRLDNDYEEQNRQLDEAMVAYRREAKARKKLYNEIQELKGNIRVYCRCRPISNREIERGASDVTGFGEMDEITIFTPQGPKQFEFDRTFDQESTQEKVFEDTQPLMQSIIDGFNVCIFAYGQTGSGKTFTMQGPRENAGVNTRALKELFRLVAEKGEDYQFEMAISILEIYCETIRDLLEPSNDNLQVRQEKLGDRTRNYVDNLKEETVHSVDDVEAVIDTANKNRSIAATNMNEYSSRSHLVMSVSCRTTDKLSGKKAASSLHMVDLAGSERVGRSGVTGQKLKEAQSINQSLSALGNVLAALGRKDGHVPYRNSKLTHVLADALGGNSKVLMFCNISPSSDNVAETVSSLQFATRARAVELGKATANVTKDK